MTKDDPCPASLPPQRRSRSASASRRTEMRRVEQMTVEERMRAALTTSRRFAWLQPTTRAR